MGIGTWQFGVNSKGAVVIGRLASKASTTKGTFKSLQGDQGPSATDSGVA
jgi:hypothetical protein